MEATATAKYVRISPRKVRLEAELIKGVPVNEALNILKYSKRKAGRHIEKVLRSAMANAENKEYFEDMDEMRVRSVIVESGPTLKRIRPRAMGRAYRIRRRTSTIRVILDDEV